jgi:LysM repeat protein
MIRGVICMLVFVFVQYGPVKAQFKRKMSREDYIEAYKNIAIKEMQRSGVPASITLAQGMLESDNGNSRLAVKGNNHFGIKCHDDWKGGKIYHNDDRRKECFRKYNSVFESYEDHSDFLRNASRYAFLFELDPVDYIAWAKGLKKAGYATNPSYPQMLIKIIDENELYKYDLLSASGTEKTERTRIHYSKSSGQKTSDRKIFERNRIDYIIVQENDNYESLQKELGLLPYELFKYNNLSWDSVLYIGRELYLQPKRNRAEPGKQYHIVKEGETMYSISQLYGVKLESLYKRNLMQPGSEPQTGQKLYLRRKLKGEAIRSKLLPEEDGDEKIKFEFQ